mgnify:CR=1 FL=1
MQNGNFTIARRHGSLRAALRQRLALALAGALAALLVATPAQAKLYKCTGADGKVYYTDKLTPECVQSGAQEMKRGIVVKEYEAGQIPADPKDKGAKKPVAQPKPEPTRAEIEQQRRDRALLATYANEKEIDLARDRSLQQADLTLGSLRAREKNAQDKHAKLKGQADTFTAGGKPVPAWLQEELTGAERDVERMQREVAAKVDEQKAIRARFEADRARYRELTSPQAAN